MANKKIFEIIEEYLNELMKAKYKPKVPNGQKIIYKPFFSSIQLKDLKKFSLKITNGGTIDIEPYFKPSYTGRIEMRMGDYEKGGGVSYESFNLPNNLEESSSLIELWQSGTACFWKCVDDYNKRYSKTFGRNNLREKYVYFSKETPIAFIGSEKRVSFDFEGLEEKLKKVSRNLSQNKKIIESVVDFKLTNEERYFINSEGSKIFTSYLRYFLGIEMQAADSDNLLISHYAHYSGMDLSKLPGYNQLMEAGEKVVKELVDILKAPIQKHDTLPTILDSHNHGIIWHEVFGHGVEGHRMQEDESGEKTRWFDGKIGAMVAPEFLSVYDDPTDKNLDGFYLFDEEGVKAKKVDLIVNGILTNFLHSRQSAGFFRTKSNGHSRGNEDEEPCPRMSNIKVVSSNKVSLDELKENLIKECYSQKKEYGLLLEQCTEGFSSIEESYFNTTPVNIRRIYPDGKTQRVRRIYIVGTPYETMRNIIQTSDREGVFNGFCNAESGLIPSTETAPDALVRSLEVDVIPRKYFTEVRDMVLKKPRIANK